MDNQEIKAFVDTIYCGEADVLYHGRHYFINGPRYFEDKEDELHMDVYDIDDERDCIVNIPFETCQKTADACLQAFLEAKIWDGRTFWEAAHEMEWF